MLTEEKIRIIELKKRKEVEQSILKNSLFLKIIQVLKDFPEAKLNVKAMVNAYMDITKNGKIKLVNDNVQIDEEIINSTVQGIIYSISKEKNGVVLNSNGNIDIESSIHQRMMAQSNFVLLPKNMKIDRKKELISAISEVIEGNENRINGSKFNYWNKSLLSEDEFNFYYKCFVKKVTSNDCYKHLIYEIQDNMDIIQNEINKTEKDIFIETRDELEFIFFAVGFNRVRNNQEIKDRLEFLLESQKYRNSETGQIDFASIAKVGNEWEKKFIIQKAKEKFLEYVKYRKNNTNDFTKLSIDERKELLAFAFYILEEDEFSDDMKAYAQAVLLDINKEILIINEKDEKIQISINADVLNAVYNGTRTGNNITSFNAIKSDLTGIVLKLPRKKLKFLSKPDNFRTLSQWKSIKAQKHAKIKEQNKNEEKLMEYILDKSALANEVNKPIVQNKIGLKVESIVDNLKDINGRPLQFKEKINAVMGAYILLRRELIKPNLYDGTLQRNKRALELLEKYILADPVKYGNFINDNRVSERTLNLGKNLIKNSQENAYSNVILQGIKDEASSELFVEKSVKDKLLDKDAAKYASAMFIGGAKTFVKTGLKFVVGEENVDDTIAKMKEDFAGKNLVYKVLEFGRQTIKIIIYLVVNAPQRLLNARREREYLATMETQKALPAANIEPKIIPVEKNISKRRTSVVKTEAGGSVKR